MKIVPAFAALALAALLPADAEAQCNGACTTLMKSTGEVAGYGCVIAQNSGARCLATQSRCTASPCMNALLITPDGRVLGELDGCAEAARSAALDAKHVRLSLALASPRREESTRS
jgi:hypothetical protein